jgi:hypothetical protein
MHAFSQEIEAAFEGIAIKGKAAATCNDVTRPYVSLM